MAQIDLLLTKEEAIVLFEMLSGFSENGKLEIEDQSEQRVLWKPCLLWSQRLLRHSTKTKPLCLRM